MRDAEQMHVFLVRAYLFYLDRKPFRNLVVRLLDDRHHRLVSLVRHAPERSRDPYPRIGYRESQVHLLLGREK